MIKSHKRRCKKRHNTKRRNKKRRIYGGEKTLINMSKCYVEIYYGIGFYKTPRMAIDFRAVEEVQLLQDKYKSFINQLIANPNNQIELRLGEEPFITRLVDLDDDICETTRSEGYLAKKEISTILNNMDNDGVLNQVCFLLCNEANVIIGICNISLPLFMDDTSNMTINYLCGSKYKYSGTILLNIVKLLFYDSDCTQLTLTSYDKSVGFYLKNGFTQTMSGFNTPIMSINKP